MHSLDNQDKTILRRLIRNPRATDKSISDTTGIQLRTVGRRRHKLEEESFIRYWATVDAAGMNHEPCKVSHLYIVKFAIGISYQDVLTCIHGEPQVTSLTNMITQSHIAECDGKIALLVVVEGTSDRDIVRSVDDRLIPRLLKNHGPNAIAEISTMRLLSSVRILRNYLPDLNLEGATIRGDWPDSAIYVG